MAARGARQPRRLEARGRRADRAAVQPDPGAAAAGQAAPMTVKEVAEAATMDAPAATVAVNDLEERGLVVRETDPTNRRSKLGLAHRRGPRARRRDRRSRRPGAAVPFTAPERRAELRDAAGTSSRKLELRLPSQLTLRPPSTLQHRHRGIVSADTRHRAAAAGSRPHNMIRRDRWPHPSVAPGCRVVRRLRRTASPAHRGRCFRPSCPAYSPDRWWSSPRYTAAVDESSITRPEWVRPERNSASRSTAVVSSGRAWRPDRPPASQLVRRVQAEHRQRLCARPPQILGQDGRIGQRMTVDLARQRIGNPAAGRGAYAASS